MKILTGLFTAVILLFALIVSPMYISEKTDVVIIGAGAAGMRAALESREHTQKVILLEKMPYPGGNSNRATAGLNALPFPDDRDAFFRDTREAGLNHGDPDLVRILVDRSGEELGWLRSIGADLSDLGLLAGHSRNRTYRPSGGLPVGREISSVLFDNIRKRGMDLRLENRALSLEYKGKNILVTVENRSGREYRIKARSVVIATGGFGGNPRLVTRVNPALKGFNTTNSAGATGDFLELTEKLDPLLVDLGEIQTHPTVEPDFSILITEALRGNGGILINSKGQRFTNEMAFREALSRSILSQKGGTAWLIFDQEIRNSLKSSEYYFQRELVRSGSSLAELTETLSLPPLMLEKEIALWNRIVLQGEEDPYGRQDLFRPLNSPPYYAIKVTPGIHYCMGGLGIDTKSRVLDRTGTPLPGLFAAGEATGGIHGRDRLGGNSLTDTMVFGRIAGYEAALYSQSR